MHLLSSHAPASISPGAFERDARVKYSQCYDSNADHGAFKNHEGDLIVGKSAIEALRELCYAKAGADENADGGKGEGCDHVNLDAFKA